MNRFFNSLFPSSKSRKNFLFLWDHEILITYFFANLCLDGSQLERGLGYQSYKYNYLAYPVSVGNFLSTIIKQNFMLTKSNIKHNHYEPFLNLECRKVFNLRWLMWCTVLRAALPFNFLREPRRIFQPKNSDGNKIRECSPDGLRALAFC